MLSVIGAGFPRTGTMSLKLALERLGLGPCYHMVDVFDRPGDIPLWRASFHGETHWEQLFADFQSTSDAPGCHFWRELLEEYPNSRCILTIRDAESWYKSFRETVYEVITHPEHSPDAQHRAVQEMAQELILDRMFEGHFEHKPRALEIYEHHNRSVQAEVDPSRLLIFRVQQGWPPLCEFLGTEIPSESFPHINTRHEFRQRFHVEPNTI